MSDLKNLSNCSLFATIEKIIKTLVQVQEIKKNREKLVMGNSKSVKTQDSERYRM